MANKLGSPRTTKYSVGTAELRIAPLASAIKQTQANSIGLVDDVNIEVSQESIDLEGGFPKILIDTAVISQASSLTATLREYSRRNLKLMLGDGVVAPASEPADVSTTLTAQAAAAATALTVASGTGIATGDILVVYGDGDQANVSIVRVASVSGTAVTLDSDTPILADLPSGSKVYKANQVAIGAITQTNYFSVQMLQIERATGRPIGFHFWKGSIGAGMKFATNATAYASTELNVKLLQPSATEYGVGGSLHHLANIIPTHPTGMYFGGGDA